MHAARLTLCCHYCCRDNLRTFFQTCFPSLLTRLFGFDDQEPSWFTVVAGRDPLKVCAGDAGCVWVTRSECVGG